jgi:endonuclease-3
VTRNRTPARGKGGAKGAAAAPAIVEALGKAWPEATISLDFRNPLELFVATVLSAQCTDERVNLVTPALFERYPDAAAFAAASQEELEKAIHSTGFFRQKSKMILGACREMVTSHGGQVPGTMEELTALPGVGRKTANVILGNAFDTPGITVDTHVARVSRRLGLTSNKDPVKIERDLMELLPQEGWTDFSHRMIWHGRNVCKARKPACDGCPLEPLCEKNGV